MSALPLPDLGFAPTRPFFEAAARGELAVPRCRGCGRWQWYPPERCGACGGDRLVWTKTSGRGTLFSYAVVRRALLPEFAPFVPFATGLVALAEDPAVRIVTRLVDCDPERLRIDLPVRAVFRPLGYPCADWDVVVPFFTPAGAAGEDPPAGGVSPLAVGSSPTASPPAG
jgi:hypothetical protein